MAEFESAARGLGPDVLDLGQKVLKDVGAESGVGPPRDRSRSKPDRRLPFEFTIPELFSSGSRRGSSGDPAR